MHDKDKVGNETTMKTKAVHNDWRFELRGGFNDGDVDM